MMGMMIPAATLGVDEFVDAELVPVVDVDVDDYVLEVGTIDSGVIWFELLMTSANVPIC